MREEGNGSPKIIVDIDNTLWHLAPELWKELRKVIPRMPPPAAWGVRKSLERYIPLEEFFRVLRIIHMQQEKYTPFPESRYFLSSVKERGFYIVIASHRSPDTYTPTVNWLKKFNLLFDELHLSYDKSVLFDGSLALVDDSPTNLDKALQAGILGMGLRYPWNENSAHPLFGNLVEVLEYLDAEMIKKDSPRKAPRSKAAAKSEAPNPKP